MLTMNRVGVFGTVRACGRGNRAGMTLIEVVFAIGIFSSALLMTLSGLMSTVRANRMLAMEITANAAIRLQAEEMLAVAADNAMSNGKTQFDDQAAAILWYYGTQFAALGGTGADDTLPIGPNRTPVSKVQFGAGNRTLICRFMVPEPGGESRWMVTDSGLGVVQGNMKPDFRAVGTATIYLDETEVPRQAGQAVMWQDLGTTTNQRTSGFDMNRDGEITARSGTVSAANLAHPEGLDIRQLPIDIRVEYFNNDAHQASVYLTERRIIVTGNYSPTWD